MNPSREKNISARCELALGSKILIKKTLLLMDTWTNGTSNDLNTNLMWNLGD